MIRGRRDTGGLGGRIDVLDARMAEIDRESGDVRIEVAHTPPRVDFNQDPLTSEKLLRLKLAEQHSSWNWALDLPVARSLASSIASQTKERIGRLAVDVAGIPLLIKQAMAVKSAAAGGGLAYLLMQTEGGQRMADVISAQAGLSSDASTIGAAVIFALAAGGTTQLLARRSVQSLHGHHDARIDQLNRWRASVSAGWAHVAQALAAKVLSKIMQPLQPLSIQANNALDFYRAGNGSPPALPQEDLAAVTAVASHLESVLRVPEARSRSVALDLLASEERDPNRLVSFIKARHIPEDWISRHGINPKTCIVTATPSPQPPPPAPGG